jgi:lipid A 3-O-deacylase
MRRFLLTLLAAKVVAQSGLDLPMETKESQGALVSLTEENDKIGAFNSDRYYTQGLRLAVQMDPHTYFAVTQEINTPLDTYNPNPPDTDLPYSGVLYLSYGYGKVLEREGRRDCMFSVEAQLGLTGPDSGAETVQNRFHQFVGTQEALGWGTQIPSELVANLNVEFRRRFIISPAGYPIRDLILRGGFQAGTIRTEAILGSQIRWGWNLNQSWGQGTIRHSNAYNPDFDGTGVYPANFSSWFFADTQLEVVSRNYATNGTNFRESRRVTNRPVVLQFMAGATVNIYRVAVAYYMAYRTKEFETQLKAQCFGGFKADMKF